MLTKKISHIAIMKKSWGLVDKILSGQKTIESRWYRNKSKPWDQIFPGDIIYFKDSGGPVRAKAMVTKVEQFENLTSAKNQQIFDNIKKNLGLDKRIPKAIKDYISGKKYCILIYFNQVQPVKPFNIDKSGFGSQAAWIIVNDIDKIKK